MFPFIFALTICYKYERVREKESYWTPFLVAALIQLLWRGWGYHKLINVFFAVIFQMWCPLWNRLYFFSFCNPTLSGSCTLTLEKCLMNIQLTLLRRYKMNIDTIVIRVDFIVDCHLLETRICNINWIILNKLFRVRDVSPQTHKKEQWFLFHLIKYS